MPVILGNIDMSIKIIVINGIGNIIIVEAITWLAEKGIIDLNLDKTLISIITHSDFNKDFYTKDDVIQTINEIIKDMKNWKSAIYNPMQITIESNMISDNLITFENLRLLTVDNPLVLPVNTNIRLLITSHDVLHSWAVPAFGIKTDACPSRLNQTFLNVFREGIFYGQCSELCGVKHGFMPIQVIITSI
jgi:heme/copper-type cytochrome/quinol oxidase subunit 2